MAMQCMLDHLFFKSVVLGTDGGSIHCPSRSTRNEHSNNVKSNILAEAVRWFT